MSTTMKDSRKATEAQAQDDPQAANAEQPAQQGEGAEPKATTEAKAPEAQVAPKPKAAKKGAAKPKAAKKGAAKPSAEKPKQGAGKPAPAKKGAATPAAKGDGLKLFRIIEAKNVRTGRTCLQAVRADGEVAGTRSRPDFPGPHKSWVEIRAASWAPATAAFRRGEGKRVKLAGK